MKIWDVIKELYELKDNKVEFTNGKHYIYIDSDTIFIGNEGDLIVVELSIDDYVLNSEWRRKK